MRKHNYVVGYKGEGQVVYDKEGCVELLTRREAEKVSNKIVTCTVRSIIKSVVYKLVEVKL